MSGCSQRGSETGKANRRISAREDVWGKGRTVAVLLGLVLLLQTAAADSTQGDWITGKVEDNSDRDLQELEALFAGARIDLGSPVAEELYKAPSAYTQMTGQPNPLDALYDPPFAEYLNNDSIFGDFMNQSWGLVPPFINVTWREIYFDGFAHNNASSLKKPFFG